MTHDAIHALPADQLPQALYTAGLGPPDVTIFPSGALCHRRTLMPWQPHVDIGEAMPFVERFGLTLQPSAYLERGAWWLGIPAVRGDYALTFAGFPAAICRMALTIHYGGSH